MKDQKKTKKEKKEKQEELNQTFTFDNVSNADKLFSKTDKSILNKEEHLTSIRFKVHHDYIKKYHDLRAKYAAKYRIYSFSYNEMLSKSVLFVYDYFKKNNILKKCEDDFKLAMIKPGRRKANKRTFSNSETSSMVINIPNDIADKYMDIMYSYIINDPNDNLFSQHHSRTYFFYDFINFIEKHEKEFLEFN